MRKQQEHEADIKELKQDIREIRQDITQLRHDFVNLARAVERLTYEIHHERESAAQERKILLLEIENRFLRFEKHLPPAEKKGSEE